MYNPSMFVVVAVAGCTYECALEEATKGPAHRHTHKWRMGPLCCTDCCTSVGQKKKKEVEPHILVVRTRRRTCSSLLSAVSSTSPQITDIACHVKKREEASTIEWGVQQLCILLVRTCRRLPNVWVACNWIAFRFTECVDKIVPFFRFRPWFLLAYTSGKWISKRNEMM